MELTEGQKAAVGRWLADGASLGDVQSRLQEEFGVKMTYMEVRFLVLDIGAKVKEKETPREIDAPIAPAPGAPAGMGVDEDFGDQDIPESGMEPVEAEDDAAPAGEEAGDAASGGAAPEAGGVTIEIDKVVRAGAALSGTVKFSDGVTGTWMLDRYMRLGLTSVSKPGYKPSAADLQSFQMRLEEALSAYR